MKNLDNLKITKYETNIAALPDRIENRADWLKRQFDGRTDNEVKKQHNALVDEVARFEDETYPKGDVYTKAEIDAQEAELSAGIAAVDSKAQTAQEDLNGFKERQDNPHKVTAAQTGAYTKEEVNEQNSTLAAGITAADKKAQAAQEDLNDFKTRRDNPHEVTAAQTGAYTKAETDRAIDEKVSEIGAGDMAKAVYDQNDNGIVDDAERLGGKLPEDYTEKKVYEGELAGSTVVKGALVTANLAAETPLHCITEFAPTGGGGTPDVPIPVVGADNLTLTVETNEYMANLGGTQYGGSYDWNSGVFTTEIFGKRYTGAEEWTLYSGMFCTKTNHPPKASSKDGSKKSSWLNYDWNANGDCWYVEGDKIYIGRKRTQIYNSDLSTWKKHLAEKNLDICYAMRSTTAIQLTPQQPLSADGTNNIFSSVGTTQVSRAAGDAASLGGKPPEDYMLVDQYGGSNENTVRNADKVNGYSTFFAGTGNGLPSAAYVLVFSNHSNHIGETIGSHPVKADECLPLSMENLNKQIGINMDLLWENASPTSEFAAHYVNLKKSVNDYKIIWICDNSAQIHLCRAGLNAMLRSTPYMYRRDVTLEDKKATFTDCTYTVEYGTNNVKKFNKSTVPTYIYGIK